MYRAEPGKTSSLDQGIPAAAGSRRFGDSLDRATGCRVTPRLLAKFRQILSLNTELLKLARFSILARLVGAIFAARDFANKEKTPLFAGFEVRNDNRQEPESPPWHDFESKRAYAG